MSSPRTDGLSRRDLRERQLTHALEAIEPLLGGAIIAIAGRAWEHVVPIGGVCTTDRFLLTSITKVFTVTQLLQMVERGLLDIDAPVAEYLPEFGVNGKANVTTRQLMMHTSGLDPNANTAEGPPSDLSAEEHLGVAVKAGLVAEPGARFEYCSPAFWVIAELVTRLSGTVYTEHLQHAILDPLHLIGTGYTSGVDKPAGLVPARVDSARAHLPDQVRRAAYPAGGLVGTAADLITLSRSLLGEGWPVLHPWTVAAISTETVSGTYQGRPVTWGLGWQIHGPGTLQSRRTIFHAGTSGVGLWIDLDRGLIVALLTAKWSLTTAVCARAVNAAMASILGDREVPAPSDDAPRYG